MKTIMFVLVTFVGLCLGSFNSKAEESIQIAKITGRFDNNAYYDRFLDRLVKMEPSPWDGVDMVTDYDPDRKTQVDKFSFRLCSWRKGWEIQYWDEYSVSNDGISKQGKTIFLVYKHSFSFPNFHGRLFRLGRT